MRPPGVCLVGFPDKVHLHDPRFVVRRIEPGIAYLIGGGHRSIYEGVLTVFYPNPELFAWPACRRDQKVLDRALLGTHAITDRPMCRPYSVRRRWSATAAVESDAERTAALKALIKRHVEAERKAGVESRALAEKMALEELQAGLQPSESGEHYTLIIMPAVEPADSFSRQIWLKWVGAFHRVPRRLPIRPVISGDMPPVAALIEYLNPETTPKHLVTAVPAGATSLLGRMKPKVVCVNSKGDPVVHGISRGTNRVLVIPAIEDVRAYLRMVLDSINGSQVGATTVPTKPLELNVKPATPVASVQKPIQLPPPSQPQERYVVQSMTVKGAPVPIPGQKMPGYVVDIRFKKVDAGEREAGGDILSVRFGHKAFVILLSFYVAGRQRDEKSRSINLRFAKLGRLKLVIFQQKNQGSRFKSIQYVTDAFDKATRKANLAGWKIRPIEPAPSLFGTGNFRLKPDYQALVDISALRSGLMRKKPLTPPEQMIHDILLLLPPARHT